LLYDKTENMHCWRRSFSLMTAVVLAKVPGLEVDLIGEKA